MFAKLALRNIRRQVGSYLIYFVTVALSVALMFAVNNLAYSDQVRKLAEVSNDMDAMYTMVTVLACLITALVLSYATGFLLKLRKKEFGMYLTLGMTRKNIQTLFVCETWILSALALAAGMGAGLMLYQLVMALFVSIMEIPFEVSACSAEGILLTLAVSAGLFILSALGSLRYLKKVTVSELLKEEAAEKGEKHPALWYFLFFLTLAGMAGCFAVTYRSLMGTLHSQEGFGILFWLVMDLVMIFLFHVALSRTLAGALLRSRKLRSRGTNTVIFRGLSAKMTMNSLMIGALATLLCFSTVMSNVALGEKAHSEYSVKKDCPYDVMALFDLSEEQEISMNEGKKIIEQYSQIVSQIDYQLYTTGDTTICSGIKGSEEMEWTDTFMALSQFNQLLTGCGYEPVTLNGEYLTITDVQEICDTDLSDKAVTLGGETYTWAGNSTFYPDFVQDWVYFVVPDEAVRGMTMNDRCAAYTLKDHRPDGQALVDDLTWYRNVGDEYEAEGEGYETGDGGYEFEEECDHRVQEYFRLFLSANAGTLIIGTLYIATVFVCMALAILSVKTLSTLDDERRRFAVLYQLGADEKMQRRALFRQIGAFFLMPFALPLLMTVPIGLVFGKTYEFWNFSGLSGQRAMETAALISLTIAGVYVLYFLITYRIACDHVICRGGGSRATDAE